MSAQWFREHCLTFPHATEEVQWVNSLLFKVGGKMFAVMALEPKDNAFSFKCSPEKFSELIELPGIVPAPYLARAQWVAYETPDALPRAETKKLVRESYELVLGKLPKKVQAQLSLIRAASPAKSN